MEQFSQSIITLEKPGEVIIDYKDVQRLGIIISIIVEKLITSNLVSSFNWIHFT